MIDKLKPCPFCGGKAILSADKHYNIYSVWCDECCAGTSNYGEEKEAIDAWNSRVQPTFTPDELDAIARYMRQDFDGNCALERAILKKCAAALKGGARDD